MSDSDNIIVDTTTRIFQDLCDPQTVNNAADDSWKKPLWEALEESGLTLTWVSDELGGAGADIMDGFDVLRAAGGFAVPVPLSETMLAGWLLGQAGIVCPLGPMTAAPQRNDDKITLGDDGKLTGTCRQIPFAADAGNIAALAYKGNTPHVVLVDPASCQITDGKGIAGDALNTVVFDGAVPNEVRAVDVTADALYMMGAATRAAMIAGALEAITNISVQYAQDRVAFERPISKFQAVQHNLATLGCEAAAAAAASGSAAEAIQSLGEFESDAILLEIAGAKIRCGEAAGQGAAIAHQSHGAIGFTKEHILNRFTRRLWAWRDEFGNESTWAVRLGNKIAENGADELWPLVASR